MEQIGEALASIKRFFRNFIIAVFVFAFALGKNWIVCDCGKIINDISPQASNASNVSHSALMINTNVPKMNRAVPKLQPKSKKLQKVFLSKGTSGDKVKLFGRMYDARIHTVQNGQSFLDIGRLYNVYYDHIMKANNIKNASLLRDGQVLYIPIMN